jgi:hypothetical protein
LLDARGAGESPARRAHEKGPRTRKGPEGLSYKAAFTYSPA